MSEKKIKCISPLKCVNEILENNYTIENDYLYFYYYIERVNAPQDKKPVWDDYYSKLLINLNQRAESMKKMFQNPAPITMLYQPEKLIIGHGGNHAHDFPLLCLHPVYGVPYIPGSAVKGVLRSAWIHERFQGEEENALADTDFVNLFGKGMENDTGKKGSLVFLDAYPMESYTVGWDFQTPHYSQYYRNKGKEQPTDDGNPIPICFPYVKNTKFELVIGMSSSAGPAATEIEQMLRIALQSYGLGAKTALGYGLMAPEMQKEST